jgi:hypothetical protein
MNGIARVSLIRRVEVLADYIQHSYILTIRSGESFMT